MEPVNAQLPSGAPVESLVVSGVAPAGPAEKAGIRIGDIITHIEDKPVRNHDDYFSALEKHKPGDKVTIRTRLADEEKNYRVELLESQ